MKLDQKPKKAIQRNMTGFATSSIGMSQAGASIASYFLRDKIYTNKELAVVREYVANAIDEHRKHKINKKVLVTLPTEDQRSPIFKVRDYAKGLSDENVRNIFGMYFESTKRDDNSQIGGFGIGSKAGHAYTDTFYVTSWFEGVKRSYSFIIDGDTSMGEGKIMLLSESKSNEPSGIEVSVPVRSEDVSKFAYEFHNLFVYCSNSVETDNELSPRNEVIESTKSFIVTKNVSSDSMYSNRKVIVGFIPYDISAPTFNIVVDKVRKNMSLAKKRILSNMTASGRVTFVLKQGSAGISVSRESLEDTNQTKGSLERAIHDSVNYVYNHIVNTIENVKTFKEFIKFLKKDQCGLFGVISYYEFDKVIDEAVANNKNQDVIDGVALVRDFKLGSGNDCYAYRLKNKNSVSETYTEGGYISSSEADKFLKNIRFVNELVTGGGVVEMKTPTPPYKLNQIVRNIFAVKKTELVKAGKVSANYTESVSVHVGDSIVELAKNLNNLKGGEIITVTDADTAKKITIQMFNHVFHNEPLKTKKSSEVLLVPIDGSPTTVIDLADIPDDSILAHGDSREIDITSTLKCSEGGGRKVGLNNILAVLKVARDNKLIKQNYIVLAPRAKKYSMREFKCIWIDKIVNDKSLSGKIRNVAEKIVRDEVSNGFVDTRIANLLKIVHSVKSDCKIVEFLKDNNLSETPTTSKVFKSYRDLNLPRWIVLCDYAFLGDTPLFIQRNELNMWFESQIKELSKNSDTIKNIKKFVLSNEVMRERLKKQIILA